jgi:hypothetical protein
VSPILTRPVREQLEHDRVIRQLQARYKRKNEVIINPGNEQNQSITVGDLVVYPDLVLFAEDGRRLLGTVEVETGESVNAIEARAEWAVYARLRVPLHLYVPPACVDAVKRISAEYQIAVAELWTYTTSFDQVRFTMVHRDNSAPIAKVIVKPSALRQAQGHPEQSRVTKPAPVAATPAPVPAAAPAPAKAKAKAAAPALRQAQGRAEQSRGTKAKQAPKKAAPATLRQAPGRPEHGRGTKPQPKAKAKPAAKKSKPAAKPKKGATKRR